VLAGQPGSGNIISLAAKIAAAASLLLPHGSRPTMCNITVFNLFLLSGRGVDQECAQMRRHKKNIFCPVLPDEAQNMWQACPLLLVVCLKAVGDMDTPTLSNAVQFAVVKQISVRQPEHASVTVDGVLQHGPLKNFPPSGQHMGWKLLQPRDQDSRHTSTSCQSLAGNSFGPGVVPGLPLMPALLTMEDGMSHRSDE